jgi:hypothetical protein
MLQPVQPAVQRPEALTNTQYSWQRIYTSFVCWLCTSPFLPVSMPHVPKEALTVVKRPVSWRSCCTPFPILLPQVSLPDAVPACLQVPYPKLLEAIDDFIDALMTPKNVVKKPHLHSNNTRATCWKLSVFLLFLSPSSLVMQLLRSV